MDKTTVQEIKIKICGGFWKSSKGTEIENEEKGLEKKVKKVENLREDGESERDMTTKKSEKFGKEIKTM